MTDPYAELRKALDAKPTPGPRTVNQNACGDLFVSHAETAQYLFEVGCPDELHTKGDAMLAAAANPEVIRMLLTQVDGLMEQHRRDSHTLREYAKERDEARSRAAQAMHTAAGEEASARKAKAERDALREDAERYRAWRGAAVITDPVFGEKMHDLLRDRTGNLPEEDWDAIIDAARAAGGEV